MASIRPDSFTGFLGFVRATTVATQFANRLSVIAFATASIRGVLSGADFQGTIHTALIAMAVFYGIGLTIGELARRLIEDNVRLEISCLNTGTTESESSGPTG